jgi:hypothetical protein
LSGGAALAVLLPLGAGAQFFAPVDVGTSVNGFQDDFSGTTLNSNWVVSGANVFSLSNGMLHVADAVGDPNHLLYELPGYDNSTQEVLARMRVAGFAPASYSRGGVGVAVDGGSSRGINFTFRNDDSEGESGPHLALLDDFVVWGPGQNFIWQTNVWYWLRLRQEPNAPEQGGVNDVFAKIWLADGTVPEPANWQLAWDYTPAQPQCAGYAGIQAGSTSGSDGFSEFDVDYVLIKASGLPGIVVAPSVVTQIPVTITNEPQDQSVMELSPAVFGVGAAGNPQPAFQWYTNSAIAPGATTAAYVISSAALSLNNAMFQVVAANVVSNVSYSVTSRVARLTVIADTNPPALLAAESLGLSTVQAGFSKRMAPASATNSVNYQIRGPGGAVAILSVALDASQSNALLSVNPLTDHAPYTLTVNNVTDQSAAANVIAPDSQILFLAQSYQPLDIGNPLPPGSLTATSNGYTLEAGGQDIGGTNDQFNFSYQLRSGDFDIAVRVESLGLSDPMAKAGLMARESLDAASRFAGVFATPSIAGAFFLARTTTGGVAAPSGGFPVNYPWTWLRLQRVGSLFTGYAGVDGSNWAALGSVSMAFSNTVYFGLAVTSHDPGQPTTAQFSEPATATVASDSAAAPPFEPLAACSRRTGLVISEIMYHPPPRADGKQTAFVELFNSQAFSEDLTGYQLAGDIAFAFPSGATLPAGGFLVIAQNPADLQSVYGISGVLGPFTPSLPVNSGEVELLNEQGSVLLDVNYDSRPPWPAAADGAGHSLVLARPSYGEGDSRAWDTSDTVGGTPGAMNAYISSPLRQVVINEFLARASGAQSDYVELYNHSAAPVDVSGCVLTDDASTNKFVIPGGTVIAAAGFVSFLQSQLNFALSQGGGSIYFKNPDGSRVLDAVNYQAQAQGLSAGRWPDGAPEFYPMTAPTPGAANSGILIGDIVINELMYKPISGNDDDQYIELYNQGDSAVNLGGWSFVAGVKFTFPANTMLGPGGYLVVAGNMTNLFAKYTNLSTGNTVGNYAGKLAHKGERVALAMPDSYVTTNAQGALVTNQIQVVEDEVTYAAGGSWGEWADGGGSSLELIDPRSNHRLPSNWASSDETAKAPWTTIANTGVLDLGMPGWDASAFHALMFDDGECLLDDVEVYSGSNSNNLVPNGYFEAGTNGWVFEGNHETSFLQTNGGYDGPNCLHIRAHGAGDAWGNRVYAALTSTMAEGATATLRARVRWLRGYPEILLRFRGSWLEADGLLTLPPNLGTPGARNSMAAANAGPAIVHTTHQPALPAASQPVVVTACVQDPDGIGSVVLHYRIDPSPAYSTVPMVDDGTGGDAVANDGIYSATVPGQPAGTMVAFYIQASDNYFPPATNRFPIGAPAHECLMRFGETTPFGSFGTYHFWLTQSNINLWNTRNPLGREPLDFTVVSGNQRVIYAAGNGAGVHYGGSVWKANFSILDGPVGGVFNDYDLKPPKDDTLLGASSVRWCSPGNVSAANSGYDPTAQMEQTSFWIARQMGLQTPAIRHFNLFVNGVQRDTIYYDMQQINGDFLNEVNPNDPNGHLLKGDFWFECDHVATVGSSYFDSFATMAEFATTGGVKKTARYRWNYPIQMGGASYGDYTNWYALIDALNTTQNYTARVQALADTDEWMRFFAYEHIVDNWECFGFTHGVNVYPYKGRQGLWTLIPFDVDISFLGSVPDLFSVDDPVLGQMNSYYPFRRAYWRALEDAANGPLDSAAVSALLDPRYAALQANGVNITSPADIESYIASMRSQILGTLATVEAGFSVSNPPAFTTNQNLITLTGTAPVEDATLTVNGLPWLVTWTGVGTWQLEIALQPGSNTIVIAGLDEHGQPVAGSSGTVNVTYTGVPDQARQKLVINEIMFQPAVPGATYVELYNLSATTAFDLSGWQWQGLSYTFPAGSIISPNSFLVLAGDSSAFASAYGAAVPFFDVFPAASQPGQLLALTQPGTNGGANLVVTQVRCGTAPPWPTNANSPGVSLQLIDPTQDNWRVANWAANSTPGLSATPGATNTVLASMPPFQSLWINEVQAQNLTGLTNRLGRRTAWIELFNPGTNALALNGLYLSDDYSNLTNWAFPPGAIIHAGQFLVVFADGQASFSTTNELHTGFTLPAGSGSLALSRLTNGQQQTLDYLDYTNLPANDSYGSMPDGQSFIRQIFLTATPGASNGANSAPPPSFVAYPAPGWVYTQDFDSLPDPGAVSVNSDNPVTINGITYSLANPYDFAAPAASSGGGGLGLPALAGWYGLADPTASVGTRFGATDGDQTAGGQISFGLSGSSDRALGLLATSTTGYTAFGLRLFNASAATLSYITVRLTGEVWRQSNKAKELQCCYLLDPSGNAAFSTGCTASLPGLNVSFPTVAADVGGLQMDGAAAANQTNLSVVNQPIANWAPGAALWLMWEMADAAGKAQGLGIDNLSFAASSQPLGVVSPQLSVHGLEGTNFVLTWPTIDGERYEVESTTNLSGGNWLAVGAVMTGTGGPLSITNAAGASPQSFLRIRVLPP